MTADTINKLLAIATPVLAVFAVWLAGKYVNWRYSTPTFKPSPKSEEGREHMVGSIVLEPAFGAIAVASTIVKDLDEADRLIRRARQHLGTVE